MIIKDKLLEPYYVEIKKGNVKVEKINISNQDDPTKESKEYVTTECYPGNIYSALRHIERLKQENAEVTIDLTKYLMGLDRKLNQYDGLLAKHDLPNYDSFQKKLKTLENRIVELENKLKG